MLTREEALNAVGLPDVPEFETTAEKDPQGQWRIKVSCDGSQPVLMSLGHAQKSAEMVRGPDPALAQQIEAALEQARKHTAIG